MVSGLNIAFDTLVRRKDVVLTRHEVANPQAADAEMVAVTIAPGRVARVEGKGKGKGRDFP